MPLLTNVNSLVHCYVVEWIDVDSTYCSSWWYSYIQGLYSATTQGTYSRYGVGVNVRFTAQTMSFLLAISWISTAVNWGNAIKTSSIIATAQRTAITNPTAVHTKLSGSYNIGNSETLALISIYHDIGRALDSGDIQWELFTQQPHCWEAHQYLVRRGENRQLKKVVCGWHLRPTSRVH